MTRAGATYRVSTLGCRVNRADSLAIERELASAGLIRAHPGEVPTVWVVNTCAVTAEGMKKSRKLIRRCARSGAAVVVTGCGVDFDAGELDAPGVAAVFGNVRKDEAATAAAGLAGCRACAPQPLEWSPEDLVRIPVKVQEGCERFCTYCIVPHLRPPSSSRAAAEVVDEVRSLARLGVGEVIICGIDLGSYREPDTGGGLESLVSAVLDAVPDTWVRLSSIELSDVSDGLAALLRDRDNLCRHLHLPMQSADESVLAAMGRDYKPADFLARVGELRRQVPGLTVTTDVMVGFPGEDDPAFGRTKQALESAGFSRVHVFKYSPRRGTSACRLGDPVEPAVKQERATELRRAAGAAADRFHRTFVGRIIPVLVEAPMDSEPGCLFARAESFAGVVLEGDESLVGRRVDVLVTSGGGGLMRGSLTEGGRETGG